MPSASQRIAAPLKRLHGWWQIQQWLRGPHSSPVPPKAYKHATIRRAGQQYHCPILIETGTYTGGAIAALMHDFREIYSIELHRPFFERQQQRFASEPHITLLSGDSGEELQKLVPTLTARAVFWLDAHGSGTKRTPNAPAPQAPVLRELKAILPYVVTAGHVVLIDDAHTLQSGRKWGRGIADPMAEIRQEFLTKHPDWQWDVINNIITICRPKANVSTDAA